MIDPDVDTDLEPALQEMVAWFLRNYESVEENTPRDSGEWVYIFGEPVDAAEELTSQFHGRYTDEQIEAVAKYLEEHYDAYDWVPVPPPEEEWTR